MMFTVLLGWSAAMVADTPAVDSPKDSDPMVCTKRARAELGSHMAAKRVCMRKSEWALQEKMAQREMREIDQRAAIKFPVAEGH